MLHPWRCYLTHSAHLPMLPATNSAIVAYFPIYAPNRAARDRVYLGPKYITDLVVTEHKGRQPFTAPNQKRIIQLCQPLLCLKASLS